jgi:hypothetical protein
VSDLKRIVVLANLLSEQQALVERLEEELKTAKAALLVTEREDLPTLMTELGLQEIKLDDGSIVKVVEDCSCGITEATRDRALRWLLDNDFGGLIKTQVAVAFGRGDHDAATKVFKALTKRYPDAALLKEEVHPSTLKSFVKEQLAAGSPIPMDLFNVHPYNKATLKRKK